MQIPLHWKFRFTFWYREWHIWKRDKCGGLYCKLRSHAGSDKDLSRLGRNYLISIHTPTQGVTSGSAAAQFQSTLPRREWHFSTVSPINFLLFQSTLPRREWQIWRYYWLKLWIFQSTLPRREWRYKGEYRNDYCPISIHTPTQGVTLSTIQCCSFTKDFNPHSHAGSDPSAQLS